MFKDLIRLSRHTIVYGIGNILSRSLGFLLLPLYVNFIPADEYGKAITVFLEAQKTEAPAKFAEAVPLFERVVEEFPGTESEIGALSNLGVCYEYLHEWRKAVDVFDRLLSKEGLQDNALEVGGYLRERLRAIKVDYPVLGEMHGSGFLQGVDIIKPDGSPDPDLAKNTMNLMRDYGVLIGTTGQNYATLKIRPPIVFQEKHAEILLTTLIKALDELLSMQAL